MRVKAWFRNPAGRRAWALGLVSTHESEPGPRIMDIVRDQAAMHANGVLSGVGNPFRHRIG